MNEQPERFRLVPRPGTPIEPAVERWPALRSALEGLRAECIEIQSTGRSAFDRPHSLTYRAAEAVIIHFDDLLGRLPAEYAARLPTDLRMSAVRRTRNILSHDYRAVNPTIVWDVIAVRIPTVIDAVLG